MALISKIRQRSGLLIFLIALALAGFVVMDIVTGRRGMSGNSQTVLGEVAGQKLEYNEFAKREQILYGNSGEDVYNRRGSLWNFFVENAIVSKETKEIGLGVSEAEMQELEFGNNLSPVIAQIFQDPNTGQLDRKQLNGLKQALASNQLPAETKVYWDEKVKEITKERLQAKLTNMVMKGIYTPTWMVEQSYNDMNQQIEFQYVRVPFDKVADSEVKVSDDDLQKYVEDNKGKYQIDEEVRKLEYVVFDVIPTAADSAAVYQKMNELKTDFAATKEDSNFVQLNNGYVGNRFTKKADVPAAIQEESFSAPIGTVIGPYADGKALMLAKVLERKVLPDSVQVRHILISDKNKPDADAKKKADSLLVVIQNGGNFAQIAAQNSEDPGSKDKGGEYTWGSDASLYPEYYDYCFFSGKVGEYKIVKTAAGGYHIMNIMRYKGASSPVVKLAFVREPIAPGEETTKNIGDVANAFLSANRNLDQLNKASKAKAYNVQSSPPMKANEYFLGALGSGQISREIIRWAFNANTKVGDVAPEAYEYTEAGDLYTNKYVVVGLKSIQKPGLPSLDFVRGDITPIVKNKKKGEVLAGKIKSQDLAQIATEFTSKVDTARNVTFSAPYTQGLGNEPMVVATAFNTGVNGVSKPVVGESGVFVLKVTYKPATTPPTDVTMIRLQTASMARNQVRSKLVQALKKNVKVEDNRSNFF